MTRIFHFHRSAALIASALALVTLAVAPHAAAQGVAPAATPNADRLADEVRILAREPRNVRALLSAGELSARLNDPSAAAGFFARAQALEPGNPRVRAGQAMVMVRMERPGEALRLFAEAARAGLDLDDYASDRGLAYDLIGAQAHAQRDHRLAMRRNPDDETRRRYALSLGISGEAREAMEVLEPLLRRSDRAAWRARAFILAMTGDAAGADKIAASMMGGFGTALSPFFRRLPALPAADKAFAVHFGEIRRTPARIADASVAPPLPVLRGEPGVAVAVAQPVRVPAPSADTRAVTPARPVSRPPARLSRREQREAEARAAQAREAQRQAELLAQQQQEAQRRAALDLQQREAQRLADLNAQQAAARQRETERARAEQAARDAEARRVADAQARERAAAAEAARVQEAQRAAMAQTQPPATPAAGAETPPAQMASTAESTPTPSPAAAVEPPPARMTEASPPPPVVGREDNVIARIIAGITIPASELGVDPMPGEERRMAETPAQTEPVQVARVTPVTPRPAVERPRPEPVVKPAVKAKAPESKPADAKSKATDPRAKAADAKAKPVDAKAKSVDAKAKAADARTAKSAKEKAKPDPVKVEPARRWVQVAGGANVGDLPKTWRGLSTKAPVEFKGKQAWTTPLRFTNRLLVGPFKTSAEAQAFVNAIGKKGLSAFAWTSEAGQKIEKLAVN